MITDLEDHPRQFHSVVEMSIPPQPAVEIPMKDEIGAGVEAAHDPLMANETLGIETDRRAPAVVKRRIQSSRYRDVILGTSQTFRSS